jgi:hypothetical protein
VGLAGRVGRRGLTERWELVGGGSGASREDEQDIQKESCLG